MQVNKHGFPVVSKGQKIKKKRIRPDFDLGMKRYALIDDEADVEIVVPNFSPVLELLRQDGWKEIY